MRFVVLFHSGFGPDHFDLMFERGEGGVLRTYRSPDWPIRGTVPLQPLGNHRRDYLNYEGEISGGRGRVRRVAMGTYESERCGEDETIVLRDSASGKNIRIRLCTRGGTTTGKTLDADVSLG